MTNENISGIYLIKNTQTGKLYIGESKHIYIRWLQHKEQLAEGTHYNRPLQNDYDTYGESSFEYILYQEVHESTGHEIMLKAKLLILEHCYINYFKKHCEIYNIRDSLYDILMDTNYYSSKNEKYKDALKNNVIKILKTHRFIVANNRYELKRAKTLSILFSEYNINYNHYISKFIDWVKPLQTKHIFSRRNVKHMYKRVECNNVVYLIKDEAECTKLIKEFKEIENIPDQAKDNYNISLSSLCKKIIIDYNLSSTVFDYSDFIKMLERNNIIYKKNMKNVLTDEYISSKYIYGYNKGGAIWFTKEGENLISNLVWEVIKDK